MQAIVSLMARPPPVIRNPEALLVAAAKPKAIDITRSPDITRRARWWDAELQAAGAEDDMAALVE